MASSTASFSFFRSFSTLASEADTSGDGSESEEDEESLVSAMEMGALGEEDKVDVKADGSAELAYVRRLDPDPSQETHYVLVIHGTFDSPPKEPVKPWYFRDASPSNFCFVLSSDLRKSQLGIESVWRQLPGRRTELRLPEDVPYPFFWDGNNTHAAREAAGRRLAKLIHAIGRADPTARVHIVAHSHGGNVLLRGVDRYLTLLRKECRTPPNKQIYQEFWDAYGESYRDIGSHQKIYGVPWYIAMWGPFVLLKREWRKEPELGPMWFGYCAWVDHLLGLDKARRNKYLRKKWASSSSANCLGNLVFMGTPFYSKYWIKNAATHMTIAVLINSAMMFGVLVALIIVFRLVLYRKPSTTWSAWQVSAWVACALGSLGFVTFMTVIRRRYTEGNLYFVEKKAWSPTMHALVLNAGKLDEAALALSTEPLVRAYLMPQLKAMLTPDPWKNIRPMSARTLRLTAYNLYCNFLLISWNVIFFVPYLILRGLNYVLVPCLSNALLKLLMNLGFGLQKGELDYAQVFVEEYLRLSPETHSVTHWNVQKILTAATQMELKDLVENSKSSDELGAAMLAQEELKEEAEPVSQVAQRWKYLWDNAELETKAHQSLTMAQLRNQMAKMSHNPRATKLAFERELKLICVTLEERYKDMTGNVELSHGSYFRNRAVIAAVSYFLAHGNLPAWAPSLGDLVDSPDTALSICGSGVKNADV